MRVALDAMGGDDAPRVAVAGAVEAAREGVTVLLVGRQEALRALLAGYPGADALPLEVVDAPDVVEMQEHPVNAVRRKPGSSIVVATRLLADGRADALYSAGNSGAVMAAALFTLGRL